MKSPLRIPFQFPKEEDDEGDDEEGEGFVEEVVDPKKRKEQIIMELKEIESWKRSNGRLQKKGNLILKLPKNKRRRKRRRSGQIS